MSALSEFKFQRTSNEGFRPEVQPKIVNSMKSWESDNMYMPSSLHQNRYNVS